MQDFCVIFIYILQYRNAVEIPRLMVISCFVLCLVNMAQIGPSGILNCLPEPQCGVKWPSQIRAGNLLIRSFFWANRSLALLLTKNEQFAQNNWIKSYFFVRFFVTIAHSLFYKEQCERIARCRSPKKKKICHKNSLIFCKKRAICSERWLIFPNIP